MATTTPNLNLTKPAGTDLALVGVFNDNSDKVDGFAEQVKQAIGIVEDGDTAENAISTGQFVVWKNALKVATADISIGDTLSASNLSNVPSGGLNSVHSEATEGVRVWYGRSGTTAGTQAKTATITGVTEIRAGDIFVITFTKAQTYNGVPTLNINSLGARNLRYIAGTNAERYEWIEGTSLVLVAYDTYFYIVNHARATTTYYGLTKLSTSVSSTSTALAATASAAKSCYDLAQAACRLIAPAYDAETVYSEGDYCTYNGLEWVHKSWGGTTPAAEAWDETHWEHPPLIQAQINSLLTDITWNDL